MFTGIVEETGVIQKIEPSERSIRLTVGARICLGGTRVGDSIAVNGCCLTMVKKGGKAGAAGWMRFDLLKETWERTNLQHARVGQNVNLERALRAGDRIGGHFVTGHVDDMGRIARWEQSGRDWVLEVAAPAGIRRYLIEKGSIAVDGISLTVAAVTRSGCRLWIIPHTREVTALKERAKGDFVNLEADMLGKYVDQFTAARQTNSKSSTGEPPTRRKRALS